MPNNGKSFTGFTLQDYPKIFVSAIPGKWLLSRTTPSWRIRDPEKGFQRVVREDRARQIALSVLDQRRTFPNAIVLATNDKIQDKNGDILIMAETRFLVVDGQHRLWAQKFSDYEANYACLIHSGLSEVEMADLFLEINDNQKRVPSSLRWDLVRLVRPEDDPYGVAAVEIIYLLATEEDSPLFQRIDLTGEQSEIQLKQGSLAPELKRFLSKSKILDVQPFEVQYDLVFHYSIAIKDIDGDQWGMPDSVFYKARVLRALIRLLTDIIILRDFPISDFTHKDFIPFLMRIKKETLGSEEIRSKQGSAGIKAIYDEIHRQVFVE
jgi:DGQHR domain-containing protein